MLILCYFSLPEIFLFSYTYFACSFIHKHNVLLEFTYFLIIFVIKNNGILTAFKHTVSWVSESDLDQFCSSNSLLCSSHTQSWQYLVFFNIFIIYSEPLSFVVHTNKFVDIVNSKCNNASVETCTVVWKFNDQCTKYF